MESIAYLVAQGSLGGDSPWPDRKPVKEDRHMPPDAPPSTRSRVSSPGPDPESAAPAPLRPVGATKLLAAFTAEQSAPTRFYTLLARDSIALVERHTKLDGARVADIGGGPRFLPRHVPRARRPVPAGRAGPGRAVQPGRAQPGQRDRGRLLAAAGRRQRGRLLLLQRA